jgi:hypothetical protein
LEAGDQCPVGDQLVEHGDHSRRRSIRELDLDLRAQVLEADRRPRGIQRGAHRSRMPHRHLDSAGTPLGDVRLVRHDQTVTTHNQRGIGDHEQTPQDFRATLQAADDLG